LWSTPEAIAPVIKKKLHGGAAVAYVPWFWRVIMTIIAHIPERISQRLRY
jgi:decaprenylphospho-beta-D-erythro-pentofuranosid-2-ulose 2-reductase